MKNKPQTPTPSKKPHDPVNAPAHYRSHPSGVECITVTEHMNFCLGNAVKYLFRNEIKHPNPILDLQKSLWYLNRHEKRMLENIPSRHPIRSKRSRKRQEHLNKEIAKARSDKEWLYDRRVFLSSSSPIFAQDDFRNLHTNNQEGGGIVTPKWGKVGQHVVKSSVGDSQSEPPAKGAAQNVVSRTSKPILKTNKGSSRSNTAIRLDRILLCKNWSDIQREPHGDLENFEEKIVAISKFIGLNNDPITRAIFYIWCADLFKSIEDLKKARWYIDREIKRREKK